MLPAEDPDAPRSGDELASKPERQFRAPFEKLEATRAESENAKRRARGLGDMLLWEATWNG